MNHCEVCNKSIRISNWNYHIKTKKHMSKSNPVTESDTTTVVTDLPDSTAKQLKAIINKEKCIDQYYCCNNLLLISGYQRQKNSYATL